MDNWSEVRDKKFLPLTNYNYLSSDVFVLETNCYHVQIINKSSEQTTVVAPCRKQVQHKIWTNDNSCL